MSERLLSINKVVYIVVSLFLASPVEGMQGVICQLHQWKDQISLILYSYVQCIADCRLFLPPLSLSRGPRANHL